MYFPRVTLEGELIRLEPLSLTHQEGIRETILDGKLWELFVTSIPHIDQLNTFFDNAQQEYETGFGIAFAIIDKAQNKVIGSTRLRNSDFNHQKTEIGFTFVAKSFQKTYANTEAKLLLLTYCFEQMQFNRVEFLTDYLNHTSRNAILRLGAKQEGILRNHYIMRNGRVRDSVLFSIIANEWAGVKEHLTVKRNSYPKGK